MMKKSFKDKTIGVDRFFSDATQETVSNIQEEKAKKATHETQAPQVAQPVQQTQPPHPPPQRQATSYRINLRLRPAYREHLERESWKAHVSITEYLNNLIQADIAAKDTLDTRDTSDT